MKTLLRHWPVLLLALWFAGMTILLDHALRLFATRTTPDPADLSAPAPWRNTRIFADPDSYVWLAYARDLRESPHFRVRFTHMDNAPWGRPVHWAQLPVWSLCAIASALEAAGIPSPDSLELAGRVLLPLLGFLSFSALWLFLRRRVPPLLAALVTLSAALVLFWHFHPFRPDHHGFHIAAAAAFVLPLLFSSFGFATPSFRNRLPFLLSGFFGGIALWLGATVFFFTLAAAALAAVLAILPRPDATPGTRPCDPLVWRLWGLSGLASSLFFYLLEYAPTHFAMRLEANHPLYALSFLGIGETLCWLARFRHASPRLSFFRILHLLLALAAAGALPALVLFGPPDAYIPRSLLMLRLHARHINEFLPLHVYCAQTDYSFLRALLVPTLPALAALLLARRPFPRRMLFAMPFFVVFLALFLWQNRWEPFAAVASWLLVLALPVPPPAAPDADSDGPARRLPPFARPARLAASLPCALLAFQLAFALWQNTGNLPSWLSGKTVHPSIHRCFQYIAFASGFRPALADPAVTSTPNADSPCVLATSDFAPFLWYCARIPSVASLYWENLPGNAAAAEAFADSLPGAPDARAVVEARRISHVFMLEGAQDALFFDDLRNGIYSHSHASRTLAGTLAGAIPDTPLPPWLAVDTALNRLSNPVLYTYIPPMRFYSPSRFPLRIYSLMP